MGEVYAQMQNLSGGIILSVPTELGFLFTWLSLYTNPHTFNLIYFYLEKYLLTTLLLCVWMKSWPH